MKKSLFGYNASEVDAMLNSLREENESLNATISTLKAQIKNSETGGAKANLLEANLRSAEETLVRLTEERNGLLSQVTELAAGKEALKLQNEQLRTQLAQLQLQNEELIAASSDLTVATSEYEEIKEEPATARAAVEELVKIKAEKKGQLENLNHASEISYGAYYEMSKMRNEAIESMHKQLMEYYQFVNENCIKMYAAIEERQAEYNQMIRDFFNKASEFRVSLSSLEDKYSSMADYSLNIDKISGNMNEIMNKFIEESDNYLQVSH